MSLETNQLFIFLQFCKREFAKMHPIDAVNDTQMTTLRHYMYYLIVSVDIDWKQRYFLLIKTVFLWFIFSLVVSSSLSTIHKYSLQMTQNDGHLILSANDALLISLGHIFFI